MFMIITGLVLMIAGFFEIFFGVKYEFDFDKYVLKEKVTECFKNVDWASQEFFLNGEKVLDKNGNKRFYSTGSIDDAIKKLNLCLK